MTPSHSLNCACTSIFIRNAYLSTNDFRKREVSIDIHDYKASTKYIVTVVTLLTEPSSAPRWSILHGLSRLGPENRYDIELHVTKATDATQMISVTPNSVLAKLS